MMAGLFGFWSVALFVPLAGVLIVTYAKSRKTYPLFYILSLFTYVDAIIYVAEAFALKRPGVTALLAVSSALLIGLGIYISKTVRRKK